MKAARWLLDTNHAANHAADLILFGRMEPGRANKRTLLAYPRHLPYLHRQHNMTKAGGTRNAAIEQGAMANDTLNCWPGARCGNMSKSGIES
jgi:hypothetical protein